MERSESIKELAAALAKAQAQVKPAVKSETNPFFKTRYADFSSVLEACEEALAANGLAVVQSPIVNEAGAGVETLLMHASGEWVSGSLVLPVGKHDAQGVGSCITYARRYALEGFLRIKREEDDGHAAAASVRAAPAARSAPAKPPLNKTHAFALDAAKRMKADGLCDDAKFVGEHLLRKLGGKYAGPLSGWPDAALQDVQAACAALRAELSAPAAQAAAN